MSTKIDVSEIVIAHFRTLKDARTGRLSWIDMVVFLGLPAALAALAWYQHFIIDTALANLILPALSIFAGLLVNAIVVLYTVVATKTLQGDERELVEEIFPNLLFAILISLLTIGIVCASAQTGDAIQLVLSVIAAFLLGNTVLTLLMAIKRLFVLLRDQFS